MPLTSLGQGEFAGVLHIEDEPPEMYAQISALGFYPGMQLQVLETNAERMRFDVNGEEVVLAPLLARTITVALLAEEHRMQGPFATLAAARPGEEVQVSSISRACRGQQRRRMMDLGIVPGTIVVAEMESFSGDPIAYRVRGALVALRREQAEQIFVRPVVDGGNRIRTGASAQEPRLMTTQHSQQSPALKATTEACETCPAFNAGHLTKLGINLTNVDYVIALAGNPNTGKSTVFNALTGLRQHTGNWPGKTVTRAEGRIRLRRQEIQDRRPSRHIFVAVHKR